jgi:hypothetical protein
VTPRWLRYHSVRSHLVAPIWRRVPERVRWEIVHHLNKSQHRCWCDLVDAALCQREDDACDVSIPPRREAEPYCSRVCGYSHFEHAGSHACACYCGKFQFQATDGAIDRRGRT